MAIITFLNNEQKETGQTLSSIAIATMYGIEHNLNILLVTTDFNDETVDSSYFSKRKNVMSFLGTNPKMQNDFSNGAEGLIRMFAANRASTEIIKSYTKPILHDRLDILVPPKTTDIKQFKELTKFYPSIIETASKVYDIVMVDLSKDVRQDAYDRILEISNIMILMLRQNQKSIEDFLQLKMTNEFYNKKDVILGVGKYDSNSTYTIKNIGRYLREKQIPLTFPYNINFSDSCSKGKVIDYFLSTNSLTFKEGIEGIFYDELRRDINIIEGIRMIQGF